MPIPKVGQVITTLSRLLGEAIVPFTTVHVFDKLASEVVVKVIEEPTQAVSEPVITGLISSVTVIALIKVFEESPELKILNGRWGPYIVYKKNNYKIPKTTDATQLSLEDCMTLIDKQPAPKKSRKK